MKKGRSLLLLLLVLIMDAVHLSIRRPPLFAVLYKIARLSQQTWSWTDHLNLEWDRRNHCEWQRPTANLRSMLLRDLALIYYRCCQPMLHLKSLYDSAKPGWNSGMQLAFHGIDIPNKLTSFIFRSTLTLFAHSPFMTPSAGWLPKTTNVPAPFWRQWWCAGIRSRIR